MADINVERKSPSIWPWTVGLLVLALLIWAIAEMVRTEPETAPVAETEPMTPPAAVPSPAESQPVPLQTLAPLGSEDSGRMVQTRGTVVGKPTEEGYWLLTDQDMVIFVLSADDPETGQMVEITGQLRPARGEQVDRWLELAELRPAAGWNLHREHFIAVMPAAGAPVQPSTQPGGQQPGAQQPGGQQPGGQQSGSSSSRP